jgi:hypothetical protein
MPATRRASAASAWPPSTRPRENISAELASFDERTVDRLVEGTVVHARRRADEMAAATEQLEELGVPARIARAARDLLIELRDAAPGSPLSRRTRAEQ